MTRTTSKSSKVNTKTTTETLSHRVYGICDEINEYQPKGYPEVPRMLADFRKMPPSRQREINYDFWRQDEMQEYLEAKGKVDLYNGDAIRRLYELRAQVNPEWKRRIDVKISQFMNIIKAHSSERAVNLDFKQFQVDRQEPKDEEIDRIKNQFGGKVVAWDETQSDRQARRPVEPKGQGAGEVQV